MIYYKRNTIIFNIINTIVGIIIFAILFMGLKLNAIVAGIVTLLVYFGSSLLFAPDNKMMILGIKDSNKRKEYENLLNDGYENCQKLVQLSTEIKNPSIKQECNNIINQINNILKYLSKHPDKIGQSKKFFTYYLETIVKIMNSYSEISSQNVHTQEIEQVMNNVENSLTTIDKSLQDQFTKMLQNDALDLDTEVDLLKNSINMKDF